MKEILWLVAVAAFLVGCGSSTPKQAQESVIIGKDNNQLAFTEEIPQLVTKLVELGTFKQHQDGYSIGKNTELTELKKQLKLDDWDAVEISYTWDCSPK